MANIGDTISLTVKGKILSEMGDNWRVVLDGINYVDTERPVIVYLGKSEIKENVESGDTPIQNLPRRAGRPSRKKRNSL